jgi:hypothetical protein
MADTAEALHDMFMCVYIHVYLYICISLTYIDKHAQVNEMADAAEALHDMFESLHSCFSEGSGGASSSSNTGAQAAGRPDEGFWSDSVVAKAFGLNVRESSRCSNCQYPMPSQSYTRCFQFVSTEVWIKEWQAAEQGVEPETLLRRTYDKDIRCSIVLCFALFCVLVCAVTVRGCRTRDLAAKDIRQGHQVQYCVVFGIVLCVGVCCNGKGVSNTGPRCMMII